jgi:hypothetical protein
VWPASEMGRGETTVAARTTAMVSAAQARTRLDDLLEERAVAVRTALGGIGAYMSDLEAEIATCRRTYVTAAVTEQALLLGAVRGLLQG